MKEIIQNLPYVLCCCTISYLIGSINWALVVSEVVFKKDIRTLGSKNPGATNIGRIFGKKYAIIVTILDGSKALLVYYALYKLNSNYAIISALFVAIGHCFPLYTNFEGGKAVACFYGVILAINMSSFSHFMYGFIFPVIIFFIILKIFKIGALASLFSSLTAVIMIWIFKNNLLTKIIITIIFLLMLCRHKTNILRIINGNEHKF